MNAENDVTSKCCVGTGCSITGTMTSQQPCGFAGYDWELGWTTVWEVQQGAPLPPPSPPTLTPPHGRRRLEL